MTPHLHRCAIGRGRSARPAALLPAVAMLLVVGLLSGCGTRVSRSQVLAGAGEGEVSFSPQTLAQLREITRHPAPEVAPKSMGQASATPRVTGPAAASSADTVPAAVTNPGPGNSRRKDPAHAAIAAAAAHVVVQGAAPATAVEAATTSCTKPLEPVAIGQVGTFSGVIGTITGGARAALAAWAQDVNARGGLACHPVQLYSQDDAGDPGESAAAVKDLVTRHHVVALVGNMITFSVGGFLPAITAAKVPAVGGDTIAPEWFESPWMFPQGDSVDDQARAIVEAGVAAGHRKLGYLYCVEVPACGYLDKKFFHDGAAQAAGADPVYDSPISLTQPDFTAQCLNARNAGVDLLALGMDGAAVTRVGRSCAAVGYRPLLAAGAATFTLQNTEDPNLRAFGMVSGSPVAPWMAQDTPAARAFHDALARFAPDLIPDGETMLAWAAGKLLEAAVDKLSAVERAGELTTTRILDGLGRIHDETLGGLTGPLTFTPGRRHAVSSGCNYFERLGPNGWTTPTGSKPVCH